MDIYDEGFEGHFRARKDKGSGTFWCIIDGEEGQNLERSSLGN